MRILLASVLGVALIGAGMTLANASVAPYYNPTNPASPTGFTTGYELYRTIGCPGEQLLGKPCPVPAPAPVAAPAPAPEPAPMAAPAPAPVAAPAPAPEPAPAPVVLSKEHPMVLQGVNFAFDSAKLRPQALPKLDQAADNLKAQNYPTVQIDGYTDSTGPAAYNLKLSERRAASVKAYLVKKGVPEASLKTKGYGETNFVDTNKTRAGRQANRRVELHVE